MKPTRISESGVIGFDGKLRLPSDRLAQFYKDNKGARVIVTIQAAERNTTAAQQAYYRNYILPTLQQAFLETGERKTIDMVDDFLRRRAEWLFRKSDGTYRTAWELTISEMSDFIDWLKQFAAEPPLSVYIEDSKTI